MQNCVLYVVVTAVAITAFFSHAFIDYFSQSICVLFIVVFVFVCCILFSIFCV